MSTVKGDAAFQAGLFTSNKIQVGDLVYITQKGEDECVLSDDYKYLNHLTVKTKDLGRGVAESFCTYKIMSDDGDGWTVIEEDFENGTLATYPMLSPTDKEELWRREGIDMSDGNISIKDTAIPFDEECECHIKSWSQAEINKQKMIEEEMEGMPSLKKLNDKLSKVGDVYDTVKKPSHYQLFPEHNLEIKDINKRILERIEDSGFDINLYEAGWWQQSSQYMLRFYNKGGLEDLKKCVQTLQFVIESMEERK